MTHQRWPPARARLLPAIFVSTALAFASPALAQTVDVSLQALTAVGELQAEWETQQAALITARAALADHLTVQSRVEDQIQAQNAKIEAGKTRLNAAVLKVAEAKGRLAKVDILTEDTKGAQLTEIRTIAQATLDEIITDTASAEDEIAALKKELEGAKATVGEMKKAVSAARAAASAANLVVEAVKSAQLTIAKNGAQDGEEPSGLEADFFNEAREQAEATEKSAEVAQKALTLTMEREKIIAANLRDTEARLSGLRKSEGGAIQAFTTADKALKDHQNKWQAAEDARLAEVQKIQTELDAAQSDMEAQTATLQNDTLGLQEVETIAAATQAKTESLEATVADAEDVFVTIDGDLRRAQKSRDMQEAAILASANADLKAALRRAGLSARSDDRVVIPVGSIFKARSAKLSPAEALDIKTVLAAAKTATDALPGEIDWVLRVDSHAPGAGEESWFLSQARALSLAQMVVRDTGLPVTRVSANGFAGADDDGHVELVLTAR